MIKQIRILPRWAIFVIDIAIIVFVSFLCQAFSKESKFSQTLWDSANFQVILLSSAIHAAFFIYFQTFSNIIRYTGVKDFIRIIWVTSLSAMTLFAINYAWYLYNGLQFVSLAFIMTNFWGISFGLLSYRILVRLVFEQFSGKKPLGLNTIIFGAGESGLATKRVLENDGKFNWKIHAFIDDDQAKASKKLDGVPIIHATAELDKLKDQFEIEQLIISTQKLSTKRKNEIVDWCLANNIKVLNVPPVNEWVNGRLKSQQIRDVKIDDLLEREAIRIHNDIITKQLKGKRLLITGAAGSIGSELARQIMSFSPEMVILCDIAETPLYELELKLKQSFPYVKCVSFITDVRNKTRLAQLFEMHSPNYVFHAAAYKHVPVMEMHPSEAVLNNVVGTLNVADLSVKYHVERFVMVSTDKAVNPTNVMGASKRIAEIYIQSLNKLISTTDPNGASKHNITKFITTRFGNVLGSNGSVIPRFKEQISNGGPVTVTHPEITRYFMTIPEACQLVLEAGTMGKGGEIFVFDMGKSVKIVDLAKKMIKLSGFTLGVDIEIEYTGLRPGEKLYEELLNNAENTLPTYHDKILIAKVREYDYYQVKDDISTLIRLANKLNQDEDVVRCMKYIVPEYKSNNSVFVSLDGSNLTIKELL